MALSVLSYRLICECLQWNRNLVYSLCVCLSSLRHHVAFFFAFSLSPTQYHNSKSLNDGEFLECPTFFNRGDVVDTSFFKSKPNELQGCHFLIITSLVFHCCHYQHYWSLIWSCSKLKSNPKIALSFLNCSNPICLQLF